MFIAHNFLSKVIKKNMANTPFQQTDGERTWYPSPQACQFLKLKHHFHSPYLIKASLSKGHAIHQKDRTDKFDDSFPCKRKRNVS